MNRTYFIVLPLSLENVPMYDDEYDLSLFENYDVEVIEIAEKDFYRMDLENLNIHLFNRYHFLLGDGDYAFLKYKECEILKDYLLNDYDKILNKLDDDFLKKLLEFCDRAIEISTGIAFIY